MPDSANCLVEILSVGVSKIAKAVFGHSILKVSNWLTDLGEVVDSSLPFMTQIKSLLFLVYLDFSSHSFISQYGLAPSLVTSLFSFEEQAEKFFLKFMILLGSR